ncbi:hypothetical protein MUO79_03130 [Candidatus Bathyarchaeota archaeon]|jgi:hypothetical protein|nr:hypothetical protein [Candidatus Bathyarchaeota archaeon]
MVILAPQNLYVFVPFHNYGEPTMLPKHMPTLEGEEAEKFVRQDRKPLSRRQKEHLKQCLELYKKNPIK